MELRPLDPVFPIDRQLALDEEPVVLVNLFTLDKADEQALLRAWQADAEFMKRLRIPPKPGQRSSPRRPRFQNMPGRCEAA
jgi:hypothetical protein